MSLTTVSHHVFGDKSGDLSMGTQLVFMLYESMSLSLIANCITLSECAFGILRGQWIQETTSEDNV